MKVIDRGGSMIEEIVAQMFKSAVIAEVILSERYRGTFIARLQELGKTTNVVVKVIRYETPTIPRPGLCTIILSFPWDQQMEVEAFMDRFRREIHRLADPPVHSCKTHSGNSGIRLAFAKQEVSAK